MLDTPEEWKEVRLKLSYKPYYEVKLLNALAEWDSHFIFHMQKVRGLRRRESEL